MLIIYNLVILTILFLLLVNFLINNLFFRSTISYPPSDLIKKDNPLVSICIPARNEAKNITRCIKSLLKQDYKNIEILVLDDNSSDDTYDIVERMAKKDSRIRLFSGKPLPDGWLGKSYACQQLSYEARGDYFIFTDADTLHFSNSVGSALNSLVINKVDAISVFAQQIMVTLAERMILPFINFFIFTFMPVSLIKRTRYPIFCTAIGQFMMFKKDVYKKIGGHESVRKEILEDIHIAKTVKRKGFKFMIFDGRHSLYCRMYKNYKEVVNGISKVIFSAFDYKVIAQGLFTLLVAVLFLIPFVTLPLSLFIFDVSRSIIILNICQVLIVLFLKVFLSIRFKKRVLETFAHPISLVLLVFISINSIMHSKNSKGIFWKDRIYDVRDEEELHLLKDHK